MIRYNGTLPLRLMTGGKQPAGCPVIVLSLGSAGNSKAVAKAACRLGHEVHLISINAPIEELRYGHYWHKLDPERDSKLAVELASRIGACAALSEVMNTTLPTKAAIQARLRGNDFGQLSALTSNSKAEFRKRLTEAGISLNAWERLKADKTLPSIPFPLVIKPERGTSSSGVKVVHNINELRAAVREIECLARKGLTSKSAVLERYVSGRQFDVEGLSYAGLATILCVVEEAYEGTLPYFTPSWFLFNPPIEEELRNAIERLAIRVVDACGVRAGAWHVEIRLTKHGELVPIDYANRMGGYIRSINAASGIDFPTEYVRTMTAVAYEPPKLRKSNVLELFAREADTLDRYLRFSNKYPEFVIEKRLGNFRYSGGKYAGKLTLTAANFDILSKSLEEFKIKPNLWPDLYLAVES